MSIVEVQQQESNTNKPNNVCALPQLRGLFSLIFYSSFY